jgi:hypothetical protein
MNPISTIPTSEPEISSKLEPATAPTTESSPALLGSVMVLIQFDVSEEIHLDDVRNSLDARRADLQLKHPSPTYARFRQPPVVERLEPMVLDTGERLEGQLKYYDYGVVSVIFERPFQGSWDELVQLASRWEWDTDFESRAWKIAKEKLKRAEKALIKPYDQWLSEDYFIFHISEVEGNPSPEDLLARYGDQVAQIVRGETLKLSENERSEILTSRMSYYPNDIAIIGWNGAFVYDTEAGAETAIQLLEYSNSQLLEFRHYDELLTLQLASVYKVLEQGTGWFSRWRLAKAASRLHTVLLDVTELTERADNAIKFLSDMFSARLYRLAAAKVGVPDYKNLVQKKLDTAEDLYRFMVDQFHQSRAFVLELMVVIILIIDLVYLFRGYKPI